MLRQIHRLLVDIAAWLREIEDAIQKKNPAANQRQERFDGKQPNPKKIEAVLSFDEETKATSKTEHGQNYEIQKSIRNATRGAVIAASIYAAIVFWQGCETRRQIEETEQQFKEQQRPWVGISSAVALPQQLVFLAFAGRRPYTGVELNASFNIRNFGISPAFKVGSHVELLMTENTLKLPENEMTGACSAADKVGIGESVIFPNTETSQGFEMQQNQPISLQQVQRLWAVGCVAYLDEPSNSTRHTKIWIVSEMLQDNNKPSFVKRENRGGRIVDFFSLPVRGWIVLKTEAD